MDPHTAPLIAKPWGTERTRRSPRPFSFLVAALAICMFAAVGFRIGQSQRSSAADAAGVWQTASVTAYSPARSGAFRISWRRAYDQGWRAGSAAGRSAGAHSGAAAGRAEVSVGSAAARAVAAVLAATPVKLGRHTATERCVEVAGGLCEALGPRITGKRCPPQSVADPEGGVVCVPQVLLLAARLAGAPSASVFAR
jgi:hypothetical protein